MNSKFCLIAIAVIGLMFISMPVKAFTDDFSVYAPGAGTFIGVNGWTNGPGTGMGPATIIESTYPFGGASGQYLRVPATASDETGQRAVSSSGYWEIDMNLTINGGVFSGTRQQEFRFLDDGASYNSILLKTCVTAGCAGGYTGEKIRVISSGFTYTPYDVFVRDPATGGAAESGWLRFKITKTGANINVKIYDEAGTLLNDQTGAQTVSPGAGTRVVLADQDSTGSTVTGEWDNLLAQVGPPPSITGWTNSYTNNASLSIAPPAGQNVIFSITATSQTPDYYIWTVDGVNQSNNFSSIVLSFNTLQHVVNATVSNANGTSSPVSWTINGAAYQLPSAPTIPEGSQCAVMFDKSTQSVNSIGYVLTNVDYGFLDFNSYRTEVYSTKLPLIYSFQMDKSNATEIFTISYPMPDVYTAQVVKTLPLLGDSIICTNTTQATLGASSLFVPSIVSVGTQNNISFILGYAPNHSTDTINIRVFDSDGNLESIYGVSDSSTVAGVQYYQNVRYLKEGAYTTKLTSSAFGTLDSKASEAVLTPNNPTRHILPPSFINVSQPFYALGDTMEYGYQIDDVNYTNYSQYIAVYNWNRSATTRIISLCGKQWNWLVHLPIVNGIVLNENCDTYDLQNDGFLPGLNKLSLRGQNSTADIELAYVNFTLATTDSDGWGLSVDKTSVCVGDTVKARVIVPGVSAGTLKYGVSGSLISVSVNRTVTYPFSATSAGSILFELYDNSESLRFSQTVDIKDCVPSVTPPTTSEANALSIIDGWTQMFNLGINPISKFLFALIITVIFMLAGALVTRNLGWGTLFGIIPFVFFAFIGYFPLIIDVLVVIAIGLKLRFM